MPTLETDRRNQKAVLYNLDPDSADDYGEPRITYVDELRVRWEDRKTQSRDAQNNVISLDALAVVDRYVKPGSLMWKGSVADLPGTSFAGEADSLMSVVTYEETPDDKGRFKRRVVGLKRYKDTLGTQS